MTIDSFHTAVGLVIALMAVPVAVIAWLDRRLDGKLAPITEQIKRLDRTIGSNGGSTVFDNIADLREEVGVLSRQNSDAQFLAQVRRVIAPPDRPLPNISTFPEVLAHLDQRQLEVLDSDQTPPQTRKSQQRGASQQAGH